MFSASSAWKKHRISAAAAMPSVFGFALLATAGYAPLALAADVKTSVSPTSAISGESQDESIRPFRVHVPDALLANLRKRITATQWPDKETVNDVSQGVQLANLQALVQYWGNGYDWRKAEAKLNALPEFVTTIDGVDIQFIHVRSRHPNAMPLILTHGWPGSQFEFLKTIGPLTDPTAYGGYAEDAFDVVIPSIPGYGFSGKPTELGWGPDRVARAWDVLMTRLGYRHYVSQGGDHGSVISDALGRLGPPGLLGIHLTMPATVPAELVKPINGGASVPPGLSGFGARRIHFTQHLFWQQRGVRRDDGDASADDRLPALRFSCRHSSLDVREIRRMD